MVIDITEQDDEPRINNSGQLIYSEKSGILYIRTIRNGVQPIGGNTSTTSETDPIFNAWLISTPPLYSFTETDPTVPVNVKAISSNQTDAMDNANAPDAGNPFATIADLGSSGLTLPQVQNIAMFF